MFIPVQFVCKIQCEKSLCIQGADLGASKAPASSLPKRRPQAFQGAGLKPSKALATGFQSAKFENEYAYFLHILPHKLIFIYMFPNPLLPKARIIMHIFAKY